MDTKETNTPLPKEDEDFSWLLNGAQGELKDDYFLTVDGRALYNDIQSILTLKNKQIEDTLQTLLDSEEMKTKPVIENMLQDDRLFESHGIDGVKGYNQAITKIRNKITSMLDNQQ